LVRKVFGGCAAETNTGDFVRIGIELGAQLGNMNNAWWNQVVIEWALRTPSSARISELLRIQMPPPDLASYRRSPTPVRAAARWRRGERR
jgi:hypothetical protein